MLHSTLCSLLNRILPLTEQSLLAITARPFSAMYSPPRWTTGCCTTLITRNFCYATVMKRPGGLLRNHREKPARVTLDFTNNPPEKNTIYLGELVRFAQQKMLQDIIVLRVLLFTLELRQWTPFLLRTSLSWTVKHIRSHDQKISRYTLFIVLITKIVCVGEKKRKILKYMKCTWTHAHQERGNILEWKWWCNF